MLSLLNLHLLQTLLSPLAFPQLPLSMEGDMRSSLSVAEGLSKVPWWISS